jgi:hypothetical protein
MLPEAYRKIIVRMSLEPVEFPRPSLRDGADLAAEAPCLYSLMQFLTAPAGLTPAMNAIRMQAVVTVGREEGK